MYKIRISITSGVAEHLNINQPVRATEAIQTTGVAFQIKNVKIYALVVTFSINDNIKFLENIKQEIKKQFLGTNIDLKEQHNQKTII